VGTKFGQWMDRAGAYTHPPLAGGWRSGWCAIRKTPPFLWDMLQLLRRAELALSLVGILAVNKFLRLRCGVPSGTKPKNLPRLRLAYSEAG
jgi:hypothetical protein